jgi:hypothetical protein
MLRILGKGSLVMFCAAGGLAAGYVSYLLGCLVLLMVYGDDGQGGHPSNSLMYMLMVGSFGICGFAGVFSGLKLSSRMFKSSE